jgi:hypothetical protein
MSRWAEILWLWCLLTTLLIVAMRIGEFNEWCQSLR